MSTDRPPGDFGSRLREARERRGISLRQIANTTKIGLSSLEALERSDIARLPGGIFSRAFVRSYAAEVGLDPEKTIQDFIAQFPSDSVTAGHPTSAQNEDHVAVESDRQMATTFLRLVMVAVPIAGIVLYFSMVGHRAAPATEAPTPPVAATSGARDTAPAPAPAGDVRFADASQRDVARQPGVNSTPAPPVPSPAAPPKAASVSGDPADPAVLTVAMSVGRTCWVSATVDGQKSVDRLLQPGEHRTFDVHRELVLVAGDASALTLTLNGAAARPLGRSGEVVTVRLNPTNFKTYLLLR